MERTQPRFRAWLALPSLVTSIVLAAFVGGAWARTDASNVDTELLFNQKFFGIVSSALDEDVVKIEDVAGSKLTLRVTRDGANSLKPDIDLLDANFVVLDTGVVKEKTDTSASIVGYELPSTGIYHVRVKSSNGLTGTYQLTVKGKVPKKPSFAPGSIGSAGEIDGLSFVARAKSKLSGSIQRVSGDLIPIAVELVSPTGVLVPLPPKKVGLNAAKNTLTLANVGLPSIGSYQLRITGQGGTTGTYDVNLKITSPKPVTGAIYEDEHPTPIDDDSSPITLKEVFFGRGLLSSKGGVDVVSPFSVVKTDPVSGLPLPGTLESIFSGIDLQKPIPFNLDTFYAPMIVPRNAVLVLRFNRAPSKSSLELSDDDVTTTETPIQIAVNGNVAAFKASVVGNDVILNPVFDDSVGMPASPLAVDAAGNPVASTTGAALLSIESGPNGLTASDGGLYKPRSDLLGSPDVGGVAIGFNPGNQVLDFFKQSTIDGIAKSYSGFLPDESRPRIVREMKEVGTYSPNFLDPALGDVQAPTQMSIVLDHALDVNQNGGKGEYAGGVFRLRPAGPNREQHVIEFHTVTPLGSGSFRNDFFLESKVKIPLKAPAGATPGDAYEVVRAEYYEPDPEHPIDPATFDPNDPDLAANMKLENFLEARDRDGELQDVSLPIDPLSTLTVRFDEPMLLESFRPFESFFIADDTGSSTPVPLDDGLATLGQVVSGEGGRAMTFAPHREIQFGAAAGTSEPIGFGPNPRALELHLISVPSSAALISLLGEDGFLEFIAAGRTGVTDLGGQPLNLGPVFVNESIADLRFPFNTFADPSLERYGVVVQRFLGSPQTAANGEGVTGVTYSDVPTALCGPLGNVYGPRIADVNLFTNGFLSGAPVSFIQKIHDDFNPPNEGPFAAFPFGTSTPIGGFSVLGGARMQHVYRAVDCSPDYEALAGTLLDLVGVSFAPLNGLVAPTILPDVSIHAGHSAVVPDTAQQGGIPQFAQSGLGGEPPEQFVFGGHHETLGDTGTPYVEGSYNATSKATGEELRRQLVFGSLKPDQTTDLYAGKSIALDSKNLFSPPGSPSRKYHPLPPQGFDSAFVYDNGAEDIELYPNDPQLSFGVQGKPRHHSMVLEYRVRVHDSANPPSTQNVFTFAIGVLSSALPRFRIFTFGAGCTACCTAGATCLTTCAVSLGPAFDGSPTGGGAPLDPDQIVHAIGPNVSAPGLQCVCIGTPTNHIPCAAGLTDQTVVAPTAHDYATGVQTPPNNNNFGDNSRYFMVFDYVKRESLIRSPFVKAMPEVGFEPTWLEPIVTPPLSQQPLGTTLSLRFRVSTNGFGAFDATPFVEPQDVPTLTGAGRRFIQFETRIEGNTSTQLVPVFDSIAIPFVKS